MEIKIKLVDGGIMPVKSTAGAACFDLFARTKTVVGKKYIEYKLGVCFEIPAGYVGLIMPRSSVTNTNLMLKNCIGVIDSDFRGEVSARFIEFVKTKDEYEYEVEDRVAQIMFIKTESIELVQCDKLSATERGVGGYGSTGK